MRKLGSIFDFLFRLIEKRTAIKGKFYRKSLIIVILTATLPTALTGIAAYFTGIRQVEAEVNKSHKLQLEQVYRRLDNKLQQIELTVNRWAFNPVFDVRLKELDMSIEYETARELFKTLLLLQGSDSMISEVKLYLTNQDCLVSEDSGIVKVLNDNERQTYRSLLAKQGYAFWEDSLPKIVRQSTASPSFLVHKLPAGSINPFAELIVSIDKKQLDDMINQLNPDGNGAAFIINEKGEWITTGRNLNEELPLDSELRKQFTKEIKPSESVVYKVNGQKYSVSYITIPRTGWKFVVGTPLSRIIAPVEFLSRIIMLTSVLGLFLALGISWLASERIYKPIGRLMGLFRKDSPAGNVDSSGDEINYLENQWVNLRSEREKLSFEREQLLENIEQNQSYLRNGFLLQLVQGHLCLYSEEELKNRLEQYGWYTAGMSFMVILVQLSSTYGSKGKFAEGDEQLLAHGAANIIEEITSNINDAIEVINFHDLSIALLMKLPSDMDKDTVKKAAYTLSEHISSSLTKFLEINPTIGVSRPVESMHSIFTSLEEIRTCMRYRDISEKGQILFVDEFIPQQAVTFNYPFALEKEIQQAVRIGNLGEILNKLHELFCVVRSSGSKEFEVQQTSTLLLSGILHSMLQSGTDIQSVYNGMNLYEQLQQLRDLEDIEGWFSDKVIKPYIDALEDLQGAQIKQLIRKVVDTVEKDYMKELSLEYCADLHGTYPKRLSALFADTTGKNFIDYVTEVRMEKAKEFLRNTDIKINDIAEKVGYQPSYFNRAFKKYQGITPGEYRNNCR